MPCLQLVADAVVILRQRLRHLFPDQMLDGRPFITVRRKIFHAREGKGGVRVSPLCKLPNMNPQLVNFNAQLAQLPDLFKEWFQGNYAASTTGMPTPTGGIGNATTSFSPPEL
eukprot:CAMPEP_0172883180 /NCGR_PEP_ID=MMETSP1075-20121228/122062_1 /TAXON_ID=2916 /ORGANISM="Ceratium fusus, Strain PA161109" /LENGTH=112 /DNA_ID=CAMNT_0013736013 /DNA_START=493 /DNA_END=832 /DNA_ORIENTATION=+